MDDVQLHDRVVNIFVEHPGSKSILDKIGSQRVQQRPRKDANCQRHSFDSGNPAIDKTIMAEEYKQLKPRYTEAD